VPHTARIETEVLRDLLPLVEHCVEDTVDQGMPRSPGSVTFTTLAGAWVVDVVDPDGLRSFRVLGLTLDMALSIAAELLREKSAPWSTISRRAPRT